MKLILTSLTRLFASGVLILTASLTLPALAQGPGTGGPTPGPTPEPTPTAVPIDGGASLLLAGGAAYGLRKLRQRRAQ